MLFVRLRGVCVRPPQQRAWHVSLDACARSYRERVVETYGAVMRLVQEVRPRWLGARHAVRAGGGGVLLRWGARAR